MNRAAKPQPAADSRAVTNTAEAELLMKHLMDVMDALLRVIEQETDMVRAGNLAGAASLEASKTELSRLYLVDASRLKASQAFLTAPCRTSSRRCASGTTCSTRCCR